MDVVISLEHRFDRSPDGAVWTQTTFAYPFWTRYLEVFDGVRIVARVRDVPRPLEGGFRVDGEGVSFAAVPYYLGPVQYLLRAREVRRVVRCASRSEDAFILRVPSQIASTIFGSVERGQRCRPYGLEVVGDPFDTFAPGAVRHPLRPFFRWRFSTQLRQQCANACAAAYVTERALQARYPCPGFTTHYSSIELGGDGFVSAPRQNPSTESITLISVGTLEQLYKAPDVLIDAVAILRRSGLNLRLILVGQGQFQPFLQARAESHGVREHITFTGQVPAGATVRAHLDRADVFVLPSRQEGLPRAMIEAMARGLPCIGSTVGGIPELLPREDLVPPGDSRALAAKIREVVGNPERMAAMSARNLRKARDYHEDILRERRIAFYREVRARTEAWMNSDKPLGTGVL